jgi:hypothetical protein
MKNTILTGFELKVIWLQSRVTSLKGFSGEHKEKCEEQTCMFKKCVY